MTTTGLVLAIKRLFTVAAVARGETARHGSFVCREYQEVYLVRVPGRHFIDLEYAPQVEAEVAGFEAMPGCLVEEKLRAGDSALVPRSEAYCDAIFRSVYATNP